MSYEYSAFVRYNDPDDPLRLKNLSEMPTVTAYEGGDGDSIAGASIANITTGIYKVKVTHTALEPVLFKVIPHNDDKDDFPDEALLAEEVRFVLDDGVTLANTQGAITWGQQKILADKAGEGALHIVNENEDGVGQYNSGAVGQGNFGSMQGQVNWGSIAGQYNMAEGNVGVGQHNHSEGMSGIGQSNQATFPVDGYDPALALEATLTAIKGAGWTNETLKAIKDAAGGGGLDAAGVRSAVGLASANLDTQLGNIKTDTGNIKTDTNNVTTRLTATRAGYLDKLNVAGTLAHSGAAGTYKADVSSLALEATLTAIKGAGWTNETLKAIKDAADSGGGGGATPQQIWEYANRELSTPNNYKADVSGIPAAVWGFATRTLSGFGTLVSDIWNFATRTLSAFGFTVATSSDANVTAIKAKTDNLPASPAAVGSAMILTSAYDKAKDDVLTPLGVIDGKADAIKLQTDKIPNTPAVTGEYTSALTAIQADLNNPNQYKADVSGLAKVTDLSGLAEKTDIPSDYAKANDLSGLAKTTDITALNNLSAAEMLNEVVVGTFTLREILTILAAKSDGYPATGGGTTTITYGGIDGTPGVIVETVDEDGNRSKVEFNL